MFFADGPANCSNMSVVPDITSNAENSSEYYVLITLFPDENLMCAVSYLIQFNGESITVPVSSPSAEFLVTQAEPFDNEVVVYTLDYENRTGPIPCVFTIGESCTCSTEG